MSDNPIKPLSPEERAKAEEHAAHESFPHRVAVAVDIGVNELAGGQMDETISSRWARWAERPGGGVRKFVGTWGSRFLNLFQANHGPRAQAGDVARAKAVIAKEEASGGFAKEDTK